MLYIFGAKNLLASCAHIITVESKHIHILHKMVLFKSKKSILASIRKQFWVVLFLQHQVVRSMNKWSRSLSSTSFHLLVHFLGALVMKSPLATRSPAAMSALRFNIACFMRDLSWPPAFTPYTLKSQLSMTRSHGLFEVRSSSRLVMNWDSVSYTHLTLPTICSV